MGLLTMARLYWVSVFLLAFAAITTGTALASEPVVCASGAGNIAVSDFALSTCGIPVDNPVYVELEASPSNPAATIQMSEAFLSCQASVTNNHVYPCAVTVRDGVLDRFVVSGSPANYRLVAYSNEFAPLTQYETYTTTLPSGSVLTVERRLTYSDVYIISILVFLTLVAILGIIILAVRFRE